MKINGWTYTQDLGPVLGKAVFFVVKFEHNYPMIRCTGFDPRGRFTTWDISPDEGVTLTSCQFSLDKIAS